MHRWTAGFLLLVMLAPACVPLAQAGTPASAAMHCQRRPLPAAEPVQPAMHCHHGMAQAPQPASPPTSIRSLDCCCENHDCCRGLKTSEWARPASNLLSFDSIVIEPAAPAPAVSRVSADFIGADSARAPPLA